MKYKVILVVFLVSMLLFLLFLSINLLKDSSRPDFFFGVDAAYDGVEDIKRLVDEVKSYTNFFVIGSLGITFNVSKLNEVCQYVYESGLYFVIYTHPTEDSNQTRWIEDARQRWGDRFLGVYAGDEPGGRQIDRDPYMLVEEADNYTDAANKFVWQLDEYLKNIPSYPILGDEFSLFNSDYALYWFDYETGFDVVLCEFGWNHSRLLNVALNRGAAEMHDKDWGVMITWTYWNPPHIESGDELYKDLILAYDAGAKYVVVFNYPKVSTYGILEEEHLEALREFWRYVNNNPRVIYSMSDRVAYVLPKDYGYGFRGSTDAIWGLWEADELSNKIWNDVNILMEDYLLELDIIYENGKDYGNASRYRELIFWNETVT